SFYAPGNEPPGHPIATRLGPTATARAWFARLRAARTPVPLTVEEPLRHDPPIRFLLRNCLTDVELHGAQLCPMDKVAFGILSANRDESVFDDPHDFRLDRSDPRGHLAFGGGPHVCPGASLARLEGRVALHAFLERVAAIEPIDAGAYEEMPVAVAHGPRRLLVTLTPTHYN